MRKTTLQFETPSVTPPKRDVHVPIRTPWVPQSKEAHLLLLESSASKKRERECIEISSDDDSPLLNDDSLGCHELLQVTVKPAVEVVDDSRGEPPTSAPAVEWATTREPPVEPLNAEEPPPISLSPEQKFILDLVVTHQRSVFLTGGGGTGKSFLLREIIDSLDRRTTFVTAPTGIAALNVGGVTLHSFAGIGLGEGSSDDLLGRVRGSKTARTSWQSCRVLIIDEVSMVPKKLLDSLEYIARRIRGRNEPFGGIQLVLCGDFLQLPPVTKGRSASYECEFCFASRAWRKINPRVFILRTLFRQHADQQFATVLNELRLGQLSQDSIHTMMSISHSTRAVFVSTGEQGDQRLVDDQGMNAEERRAGRTVLRSTNIVVRSINERCFDDLNTDIHMFTAVTGGAQPHLLDQCPAEKEIALRVGSRVMLLKNLDQRAGLVNGSVGVVTSFVEAAMVSRDLLNPPTSRDWLKRIGSSNPLVFPVVRFAVQRYSTHERRLVPMENDLVVQPQNWSVMSGNRELAFRWQIPLKLAWAITIHKSQGMTLQNVNVDFDGMFEDAQAYVALSRCTTLQGLTIENFDLRQVRTNVHALAFYDDLEAEIAARGGDSSLYVEPTVAENPWGATQPDSDDETDDVRDPEVAATQAAKVLQLATVFNDAVKRIRSRLPSALIEQAASKSAVLSKPVAAMVQGRFCMTQGADCGTANVRMSELVIPLSSVASCYVVLDTCSLVALHGYTESSPKVCSLCESNFVRVPQMVLAELDGLTKRDQPQVAFAARRARNLLRTLLQCGAVELQGSDHSVEPSSVFAFGGDGTNFGDATDETTRKDNPILCYAAYLQRRFRSPVVICTEDCLLGLRANACGFSSCSVSGG